MVRWQYSWARTLYSRFGLVMTLVARSIVQWCRIVGGVVVVESLERMVSRRQFARPAVVLRVLLQRIFTPPVGVVMEAMRPFVMVVSRRVRKVVARECFSASKTFCCVRSWAGVGDGEVERLIGDRDLLGLVCRFRGEVVGEVVSSSLSLSEEAMEMRSSWLSWASHFCFLGETSGFEGENLSWCEFTRSASQKASRLWRWRLGAVGIWTRVLEGEISFDEVVAGTTSGGVVGREIGGALRGERSLVGVGRLRSS